MLNALRGDKVEIEGAVYLRTGSIETNSAEFDTEYFSDNIATAVLTKAGPNPLRTHTTVAKMRSFAGAGASIVGVGEVLSGFAQSCYSNDGGATWTNVNTSSTTQMNSVAYGAGGYVSVANSGKIFTSPSGAVWTEHTSGTGQNINYVYWTGTAYIAVGNNGVMLRSTDGVNWTLTQPQSASLIWLDKNNTTGLLIAATSTGNLVTSSNDGGSWTLVTNPLPTTYGTPTMRSIVYAHSKWWVSTNLGIYTSTNGTTSWTHTLSGSFSNLLNANGELFATGIPTSIIRLLR